VVLDVQNEKLLVGCVDASESSELVGTDGVTASSNDSPEDNDDSEASPVHFDIAADACVEGESDIQICSLAAAEGMHKAARELVQWSMETESSESSELLNDCGNGKDDEPTCEDPGLAAVDSRSAGQYGITAASDECGSSCSHIDAVDDVSDSDDVFDGNRPSNSASSCVDLTRVSRSSLCLHCF